MIGIGIRIAITQRQKHPPKKNQNKTVVGGIYVMDKISCRSCKTWMCLNYPDSAENQLTPGKQTAESPEGRKKSQWRNLF